MKIRAGGAVQQPFGLISVAEARGHRDFAQINRDFVLCTHTIQMSIETPTSMSKGLRLHAIHQCVGAPDLRRNDFDNRRIAPHTKRSKKNPPRSGTLENLSVYLGLHLDECTIM